MDNDDEGPENKGSRGKRPLPKSLTSNLTSTEQESGGASGQSGGASSQPSRPANQAPDGTILVKMDVKNGFDNPRTNLHQFGGPNNLPHRELTPHPGYGYSCVMYKGETLWTMDGCNYATRVTVFPTEKVCLIVLLIFKLRN
uniref:Uncharacterized protein n=1 Tax=Theileria parva TaxID=5875 RepID=Q4N3U9_THEPA|eukprot:XP_765457.1 hypothetical protein [Theileria parva strain Muguga]